MTKALKYQIRCWRSIPPSWELWTWKKSNSFFKKGMWVLVSSHATEEEALKAMSKMVPSYYSRIEDYDENGAQLHQF